MLEVWSIVKVALVLDPEDGTFPAPDHPVQLYLVPLDWSGLVTDAVTEVPELYQLSPTAGVGESCAEVTVSLYSIW